MQETPVGERGSGTGVGTANKGCDIKQLLLWVTRAECFGEILGNGVGPGHSPALGVRTLGYITHMPLLSLVEGCFWESWTPWHYRPSVTWPEQFSVVMKNSSKQRQLLAVGNLEEYPDEERPEGWALLPLG